MSQTSTLIQPIDRSTISRATLHRVLAEELSSILQIEFEQIDVHKSLDEYGLDSIDAVIASGAIADRLGIGLPPELLIQHRQFHAIEDAIWKIYGTGLAPAKLGSPVYLFPGGAGRNPSLSRLANHCGSAATFEIIGLGSWQDWLAEDTSFDDLVERACAQILASRGDGEIRLAGYSMGGQIAFAVARALSTRNIPIRSLCIFDSLARPYAGEPIAGSRSSWVLRSAHRILTQLMRRREKDVAEDVHDGATDGIGEGDLRVRVAVRLCQTLPAPLAKAFLRRLWTLAPSVLQGRAGARLDNALQMQVFAILLKAWWPDMTATAFPITVTTTLFRSQEAGPEDLGWHDYIKAITILHVPGTHLSMFDEDRLPALADQFIDQIVEPSA